MPPPGHLKVESSFLFLSSVTFLSFWSCYVSFKARSQWSSVSPCTCLGSSVHPGVLSLTVAASAAPGGLVLILDGKRLSFRILMRIWRLAWFLLQAPPSGRTAKRTLEWVAFTPDSEGACGLGNFLFLV